MSQSINQASWIACQKQHKMIPFILMHKNDTNTTSTYCIEYPKCGNQHRRCQIGDPQGGAEKIILEVGRFSGRFPFHGLRCDRRHGEYWPFACACSRGSPEKLRENYRRITDSKKQRNTVTKNSNKRLNLLRRQIFHRDILSKRGLRRGCRTGHWFLCSFFRGTLARRHGFRLKEW